jgi:hypothetical protein
MMKRRWMLKMGLGLTVLLTGLPYWLIPQYKVSLTSWTIPGVWLLVTFLMALIIQNWSQQKASQVTWWVGSGALIAVFLRILFDSLFVDPMSHKMFWVELTIAYGIGIIAAAIGAFAAQLVLAKDKETKKA